MVWYIDVGLFLVTPETAFPSKTIFFNFTKNMFLGLVIINVVVIFIDNTICYI